MDYLIDIGTSSKNATCVTEFILTTLPTVNSEYAVLTVTVLYGEAVVNIRWSTTNVEIVRYYPEKFWAKVLTKEKLDRICELLNDACLHEFKKYGLEELT
jgi:hypothetical protein